MNFNGSKTTWPINIKGATTRVQMSNLGRADAYIVKINQNLTNLIK